MLARRGNEGGGMVARAACAFVTPVILLLLYILGRPVRSPRALLPSSCAGAAGDERCGTLAATDACGRLEDILVAVGEGPRAHARRLATSCLRCAGTAAFRKAATHTCLTRFLVSRAVAFRREPGRPVGEAGRDPRAHNEPGRAARLRAATCCTQAVQFGRLHAVAGARAGACVAGCVAARREQVRAVLALS
jgi:hypothetical protein